MILSGSRSLLIDRDGLLAFPLLSSSPENLKARREKGRRGEIAARGREKRMHFSWPAGISRGAPPRGPKPAGDYFNNKGPLSSATAPPRVSGKYNFSLYFLAPAFILFSRVALILRSIFRIVMSFRILNLDNVHAL